jgi:hypothetical protein
VEQTGLMLNKEDGLDSHEKKDFAVCHDVGDEKHFLCDCAPLNVEREEMLGNIMLAMKGKVRKEISNALLMEKERIWQNYSYYARKKYWKIIKKNHLGQQQFFIEFTCVSIIKYLMSITPL